MRNWGVALLAYPEYVLCLQCQNVFREDFELGDARSIKISDDFLAIFQADTSPLISGTPTVFEPIDFA